MPFKEKSSKGIVLVRNFEFPTAINHIGRKSIQFLDFGVSAAFAEIFHGNIPKCIALHNRMDTVIRLGCAVGRINGSAVIGKNKSTRVLICGRLCIGTDSLPCVVSHRQAVCRTVRSETEIHSDSEIQCRGFPFCFFLSRRSLRHGRYPTTAWLSSDWHFSMQIQEAEVPPP